MGASNGGRFKNAAVTLLASLAGGVAAVVASTVLTLLLSLAVCLGLHPETTGAAEWAAPVIGVIWAGALVRRAGRAASLGAGLVVGLAWAFAWLYLVGRFDIRLWFAEALPAVSWAHVAAWVAAPVLGALGGALAIRLRKANRLARAAMHIAAPAMVLLVALASLLLVDGAGRRTLADGVSVLVQKPHRDGTTVRLLTFDFAANANLRVGLYDCDSDDSRPYDDTNSSYFATPAVSVFEKIGADALCVVNAGFFAWTQGDRIGWHVAPIVQNGRARYSHLPGPDVWTFGWRMVDGVPNFLVLRAVPFDRLEEEFDTAIGHVRALVVDGKALKLGPGAGVTTLKCSRTSLGWSSDSSKLHVLVVRDPDSERASIAAWKGDGRQIGGWDLLQVQRFWTRMGVDQAIALDGGDSTQLVYPAPRGPAAVNSGRLSVTLGYLRERPLRLWVPILPARHSDGGVMNYIFVEHRR